MWSTGPQWFEGGCETGNWNFGKRENENRVHLYPPYSFTPWALRELWSDFQCEPEPAFCLHGNWLHGSFSITVTDFNNVGPRDPSIFCLDFWNEYWENKPFLGFYFSVLFLKMNKWIDSQIVIAPFQHPTMGREVTVFDKTTNFIHYYFTKNVHHTVTFGSVAVSILDSWCN